jgi:hypothetical protein
MASRSWPHTLSSVPGSIGLRNVVAAMERRRNSMVVIPGHFQRPTTPRMASPTTR